MSIGQYPGIIVCKINAKSTISSERFFVVNSNEIDGAHERIKW